MNPKLRKRQPPIPGKDTCHRIPVLSVDGPVFDLLIYGLEDSDIYLTPNPYVSQALNHRRLPLGLSVSPFLVERIR